MRKPLAIVAASAIALATLAIGPAALAGESITGSGSSYAAVMINECRSAYTEHSVTYNSTGSGTGKTQFANGTTNFGASDSLYGTGLAPKNFTYVPLIAGPIAITYNIPGLKALRLDGATLSKIFLGEITKWNDKAITGLNKGIKLPNENINVIYRKDASGTSFNFSNWMFQVAGSPWKANDVWVTAAGKTVGTSGDKNQGVKNTQTTLQYSIAYMDLADALTTDFGIAAIKNGSGQFVKATVASSAKFMAAQSMKTNGQVLFDYNKKVAGGYSVTLVAYGMAPTANKTAKGDAVRGFFDYMLNVCAPAKAAAKGYVAFTGNFLKQANKLVAKVD